MGENVYLKALREQYQTCKRSIDALQNRAAEEKRELNEDELRSVTGLKEKGEALFAQIEDLTEVELRNAKVAAMTGRLSAALDGLDQEPQDGDGGQDDGGDGDGTGFRSLGGARTRDRDPGIYVRGSQHSFIGDQFRSAKFGDRQAADRLIRHSNALKSSLELRDVLGGGGTTFGAGLVPPVWLAEQFAPILHRRLRVAGQVRQIPWPGTPFPWSIPISGTAATGTVVAEGVNPGETDPSYTVLTVTPKTISGFSEVSRQMLEASNPAVDAIIWGDLIGDFFDRAEQEFITALNAQSGVNTVTVSAGTTTTSDILAQRSGLLDAISAISDNSAGDATIFAGRNSRWTTYLKFQDTVGRPLIVAQQYQPQNAVGRGDLSQSFRSAVQGNIENLDAVTSPTIAASTGFVINGSEVLFSYSPPMQFRFEEPAGPALIRVGVWGYCSSVTGRRPKAITKITYSGS